MVPCVIFLVESVLPQLVQVTVIMLAMPLTVVTRQFSPRDCPTVGMPECVTVTVGSGTGKYHDGIKCKEFL